MLRIYPHVEGEAERPYSVDLGTVQIDRDSQSPSSQGGSALQAIQDRPQVLGYALVEDAKSA